MSFLLPWNWFGPSKREVELQARLKILEEKIEDINFERELFKRELFTVHERSLSGNDIRDRMRSIDFKPILEKAISGYVEKVIASINIGGESMSDFVSSRGEEILLARLERFD